MDDRDNPDGITDDTFDGRDATIFLVDASAPMFEKTSPSVDNIEAEPTIDDCPFTLAIRCAFNTLKNKIFTAPYDSVAIVLFGTKKKKPNEKYGVYSNTYLLQDLQKPDCDPILQLDEMLNKDGGIDEYVYAVDQQSISLADALWLCSSIFSKQYVVVSIISCNVHLNKKIGDLNLVNQKRITKRFSCLPIMMSHIQNFPTSKNKQKNELETFRMVMSQYSFSLLERHLTLLRFIRLVFVQSLFFFC